MKTTLYRGVRFPKAIIQHAIWLYLRITLSLRDVEELLAERGITVTYETVRARVARFGPPIVRRLRRRRGPSTGIWHLDAMVVKIAGRRMYLWRAGGRQRGRGPRHAGSGPARQARRAAPDA